jgi:hypothetical protein
MITLRFLLSWILSSVVMWALSYTWHGFFLNDIVNMHYPKGIYLVASTVVYLVIGLVLTKLFTLNRVVQMLKNLFVRGVVCGSLMGILLYMFALVLGVTFTKNVTMESMAIDIPWQILEQAFGGTVIALISLLIYEPVSGSRSEDMV